MEFTVQKAKKADFAGCMTVQKEAVENTYKMISTMDEFESDQEEYEQWFEKLIDANEEPIFVAKRDEIIIGWLYLSRPERKKMNHSVDFGIAVKSEYRGKRVGSTLIQAAIDWARAQDGVEKITLGVLSTNTDAIRLYEKLGFKIEGQEVKSVKFEEGTYADEILMYRFLD